jgi:hypothetical protein
LAEAFAAAGREVVTTREPGGTPLGEKLRTLALNDPMDPLTEALLMFAARREHLVQVIEHGEGGEDWVEHAKLEMYLEQVFVFTPKGSLITLPRGGMARAARGGDGGRATRAAGGGEGARAQQEAEAAAARRREAE